jgi:hypothetical protein
MLDSNVVRDTIARLKAEGWHYERELFTTVHPYQLGTVVETIQVLTLAGCIRAAGEDEKKRYRWIGKV